MTPSKIPLCIGQFGWDLTTLGSKTFRSHGGTVLHFASAALVCGVPFALRAYVNTSEWASIIATLSSNGAECETLVEGDELITFKMVYDDALRFCETEFEMLIPEHEPDIVSSLSNSQWGFAHLCPTDPDQDREHFTVLRPRAEKLSMQLHINNLIDDLDFYRAAVAQCDYIFLNEEEAKLLVGQEASGTLVDRLRKMVGGYSYVTSAGGAQVIGKDTHYACSSLRTHIVDPTGAGDAFAGACTAGRMLTGRHDVGLRLGTLCAAAKLTDFSSNALLTLLGYKQP